MLPAIQLRPECGTDGDFLRTLYISTRWEELTAADWPEDTKLAFLQDQFRLQCLHYRNVYREASFDVVVARDEPIGRLYLHRGECDHRVVDISLIPRWRGRGVGGALLREVQTQAQAGGQKVSIHVEFNNPAQRLYRRLGFEPIEDKGIYILMEWQP